MCGILGLIGPRTFDADAFGKALDVMKNRGPDDRGIYEEPECLLGHRRLAILDLSPAGHQPMSSRDGRYVTVYNGEVYNFLDLRRELEAEGERFATKTDTEVILALYAKEGPNCLQRFRGMFAIAIWDKLEKSLFLARDRMGIKPLYVWPRPDGISFASEVKAIRALPGGPSGIEPEAVVQYLAWGSVPAPLTITKGVESMMPATWLLWKRDGINRGAYWDFPVRPGGGNGSSNAFLYNSRDQASEALRPLLREAVAYRCISDAPLGAFLSGGVDSSSVVALMRAAGQQDLRTFSISFPQTALDEGPYAIKVAEEFATSHNDVSVTVHAAEDELDGFFAAMDQPTCDGFNTYMVSKFARQGGLTVSLSGLGGDELFAGYPHYQRVLKALPWLRTFPRLGISAAAWGAAHLNPRYAKLEALTLPGAPIARLYYAARGLFMPSEIRALVHPDLLAQTALGHADASSVLPTALSSLTSSLSPLHGVMALELRRYMHNQLLRDSDVFGMAQSLEIRVPLIDHRIVEAVFRIDPRAILGSHDAVSTFAPPKALLMNALPTPLPQLCTHRPKMGFTFPFERWMQDGWRARLERDVLQHDRGPRFLAKNAAIHVWESFNGRRVNWCRPWSLVALKKTLGQ